MRREVYARAGRSHSSSDRVAMPAHEEDRGGSRADGSLGKLTKSFVQLVQQAPNGILDLNNAAAQLDVRVRAQAVALFRFRCSAFARHCEECIQYMLTGYICWMLGSEIIS